MINLIFIKANESIYLSGGRERKDEKNVIDLIQNVPNETNLLDPIFKRTRIGPRRNRIDSS